MHKKDVKLVIHYGNLIETHISKLDGKFAVLMNYAIMNNAFFSRDFLKGIIYANNVLEFQQVCFSPVIRVMAVYALTAFYSMLKDYDKIIESACNEVLYLQFDEEHQMQYFSMLQALDIAYIMKKEYEKAFEIIKIIREYNFSKHKILNAYIPMLEEKKQSY